MNTKENKENKEIEVTDEMVEAGLDVFYGYHEGRLRDVDSLMMKRVLVAALAQL